MATSLLQGGCLCGAVRYQIDAAPTGSMICHCQTCRRLSGAPVVAWISVSRAQFRLVKGKPVEYSSSAPVLRTHCAACGTPLTYRHANDPEYLDVTICSLDSPDAFPPTHHSWLSHDLAWVKFGDGLPVFQQSRTTP